jgi:thymidylate synthase
MNEFDQQYQELISTVLREGSDVPNPWSGRIARTIPGATLRIDLERDGFPLLTLRKIPVKLFVAEQVWYLMGENRPTWLQQFTNIWDEFLEQDGTIEAAYGYRWRKHFGRDQIQMLVAHLTENPSSRHGVVMMWDPATDGLAPDKKKNLPCPVMFTLNLVGGRAHLHVIIRSNDLMLGCPHDIAGFAFLEQVLAQKLGVPAGILTYSISNAHIYDNHFEQAAALMKRQNDHPPIFLDLPPSAFDRAITGNTQLVDEVVDRLASQYQPLEPIKGMKITVNVY